LHGGDDLRGLDADLGGDSLFYGGEHGNWLAAIAGPRQFIAQALRGIRLVSQPGFEVEAG
jgi:hypothetical protein